MSKNTIRVGDKVKLTGKHLKSTGQRTGAAGLSTWIVTAISGNFAVTNQESSPELVAQMFTAAELASDPTLKFRRIHVGNLFKVGTLTSKNCT